ncbi:MAG TPA: CNNM domain-containing protein [Candidatus Saccharimonadales bacterium]|jgi:metal transporter CNNM|nr:CNNM domain-containing protein [Candidatus Saccharimonadales bacterium]
MHSGGNSLLIAIEVILLILVSAICSGLNIAVMSLDLADLKRKAKLGNKPAARVLPLRRQAHLTLASILLTNIAAVSATSLVLGQRLNGWFAGLLSTLLIVIFGEVMPQALFSRNALGWSSLFAPVLRFMIVITYLISKPLQLLLDGLFPRERPRLQSRHELGLLITEHQTDASSELDDDEIEIMRGALALSEKRVRDIMTDIRHSYWLTPDTMLDGPKIDEIKDKGFSRIPIFNPELTECYGLLLMKDLIDVDFDDNSYCVNDMPLRPTKTVGSMTALDTMFRKFIAAGTHLMPVEREDEIIGIVTIEDLLEEIIGHEIEDETDRQKRPA